MTRYPQPLSGVFYGGQGIRSESKARLKGREERGVVMKLPVYGAVVSIALLFVALFLRREDVISDPFAVPLVAIGVVGFAGCAIWAGVRSLKRSAGSR